MTTKNDSQDKQFITIEFIGDHSYDIEANVTDDNFKHFIKICQSKDLITLFSNAMLLKRPRQYARIIEEMLAAQEQALANEVQKIFEEEPGDEEDEDPLVGVVANDE